MALKDEIRRNRKRLKLTLAGLSQLLGISMATLVRWERGKFEPGADKLMKMAKIFGISETELLHPAIENGTTAEFLHSPEGVIMNIKDKEH